eukprot:1960475-Pyramimonas_sp.AAC.1
MKEKADWWSISATSSECSGASCTNGLVKVRKSSISARQMGHVGLTDCHRPAHRVWKIFSNSKWNTNLVSKAILLEALLEAHTSLLEAYTSLLEAYTSLLEAHTSLLEAHIGLLEAYTSLLEAHTGLLEAHTSLLEAHTSLP